MAETKNCPKCGAEPSPSAPFGICPKCLIEAGLGSDATVDQDSGVNTPLAADEVGAGTIPPAAKFPTPSSETLTRQFPQLEILELLGQGGMGVVYKARQRRLNRLVALKILPPSVGEQPAFAERFSREAQALARLNHWNIVQVHDFGETDEFFYFIMEFVDGVNLRALIRDGKLKPEEALAIIPQICEALQFAHDEGIVHRDIKPENILIDKRGRLKIADFGLAKLLSRAPEDLSLTGTGQLMGTFGYMAPEQLQEAHAVDHRADIYSLGVVFYEMLTGQLPIGKFDPPSKKVQVDVRLDDVVLHALESEPDRRYQHASEVKTDVESIRGAPWPHAGSRAPFATATSLPPREPLGTGGTQVPAPAGFNDRFFATGLRRLVFSTTSWAIVLCVLGITGTFLPWIKVWSVYSFGSAWWNEYNAYFTWPGIPMFSLFVGLGLLLAIMGFEKPVELWQPLALILTAVTLIVLTALVPSTVESKLLASPPTNRVSINLFYDIGVYIELAISAGLLVLGFVQMRRRRGELATVRAPFDDEYFQHEAGRSESGAKKPNGAWTEQPAHPMLAKLALFICLGGAVVALSVWQNVGIGERLLIIASQVVSLVLGIVSRREALGRASAVASGILLLLSLVVFAMTSVRLRDEETVGTPGSVQEIARTTREATPPNPIPPQVIDPAHLPRPLPNWTFGPDGPTLTDVFARSWLRRDQVGPVNKALQESFRDYLNIEKRNMDQSANEEGHLVTVIRPLSKELGSLEDRLWSRLDPILDREQQNLFRLNLELYPRQSAVGVTLPDLVRPGLFGWGRQGARIEIWREGTWFRWNVSSANYADFSNAPELPEPYRRFWK
jgi:tRNA A-37 threonylcarbamoyl transferase component Bud32